MRLPNHLQLMEMEFLRMRGVLWFLLAVLKEGVVGWRKMACLGDGVVRNACGQSSVVDKFGNVTHERGRSDCRMSASTRARAGRRKECGCRGL